ncbi:unnamed protein product [Medioppia subpectinata]|uniref:Uncharacterized protein n=1 Tax=Medioppia subpectinata TaxID=1979941 RepID=A0A7R9Q4J2_9ACAR|nr:unnamed protein product [Medioppia subpectinata]CAG2112346.1 unnamed protein product [Medioppia subpectinata]
MISVGLLGGNLWPNGWEAYQEHRPVAYLPSRYELVFIINGRNFSNTVLAWNSMDTKNWNSSWRYKDIGDRVVYTGMFEMNGIVYAIGETKNSIERVGKIYRYHILGNNDRKLTETNQMVSDFFGCPAEKQQKSYTLVNTIRTNREIKTGSVLNKLTTKDDDSILISIFIGIVITACLTTIVLSFLTITGRKKSKLEAIRAVEPTIPKLPVVGLDYSPRQTSNVSRFDTMSSITAIYSQITRPVNKPTKHKAVVGDPQPTATIKSNGHNGNHKATSVGAYSGRTDRTRRSYHTNSVTAGNTSVNCISNGNNTNNNK